MFHLHHYFRTHDEEVASKVIDGEAIIINLGNGIYYSMDKVGALVWERLQKGNTLEAVIDMVTCQYEVTRDRAEMDIRLLVQDLVKENLLVAYENGDDSSAQEISQAQDKMAYEAPHLNIYRDMGDLLALDPPVPGLGDTPWKDSEE
jgi:hypothetical protein